MISTQDTYFHFAPQKPVLTKEVMGFLQNYSGCFYPKVALKTVSLYRFLIRSFLCIPEVTANESTRYSMTHHTFVDGDARRFEIFEKFSTDNLVMEVVASNKEERDKISGFHKKVRKQKDTTNLLSGKAVSVMLVDELRLKADVWQEQMAAVGIPAASLLQRLSDFLAKGAGSRLFCSHYHIQKTDTESVFEIDLYIPTVSSHFLRVRCKFA